MYYEKINGWFDFNMLYDHAVASFNNAVFVEIGTWKGKSAIYMGEKIKESGKSIKFHTIDIFSNEGNDHVIVGDMYAEVMANIEPVKEYVSVIKGSSHDVHEQFADESIDFLFIDGNHKYDVVKKDLTLWYPKVKIGGIISGHDYTNPCGVKQAVDEFFHPLMVFDQTYRMWMHKK